MAALGLAQDPPGEDIYELIKQALCTCTHTPADEALSVPCGIISVVLQLTSPGNLIKDKNKCMFIGLSCYLY